MVMSSRCRGCFNRPPPHQPVRQSVPRGGHLPKVRLVARELSCELSMKLTQSQSLIKYTQGSPRPPRRRFAKQHVHSTPTPSNDTPCGRRARLALSLYRGRSLTTSSCMPRLRVLRTVAGSLRSHAGEGGQGSYMRGARDTQTSVPLPICRMRDTVEADLGPRHNKHLDHRSTRRTSKIVSNQQSGQAGGCAFRSRSGSPLTTRFQPATGAYLARKATCAWTPGQQLGAVAERGRDRALVRRGSGTSRFGGR